MFAYTPVRFVAEAGQFLIDLWRAFRYRGGPALLGLILLFYRNWKIGFLLAFEFIFHVVFFVSYRALDKELMFLPAYLIWAIWLGIGYAGLLSALNQLRIEP